MSEPVKYSVEFSDRAIVNIRHLDTKLARRVRRRFSWLAENVLAHEHDALKGDWAGYYRIRIGDYRAIYRIDHDAYVIVVEEFGLRRDVYDV
jgi:mRNA interferase RelE/StbE